MDVNVLTTTGRLAYTVRAHEGDVLVPMETNDVCIRYGPKGALKGKTVVVHAAHIVEVSWEPRMEKRVRPSRAALLDPDKAAIADLATKLGA